MAESVFNQFAADLQSTETVVNNSGQTVTYAGSNPYNQVEEVVVSPSRDYGRRVVLKPKSAAMDTVLGSEGLLQPLFETQGMVWPYQPSITWEQGVTYNSTELVHTNQEIMAFVRSSAAKFTVAGKFSVQNQAQGLYALACIHFMRVVTKMNFGDGDALAGTPPPILEFSAYGQMMFNHLPVIVTGFTVTMPEDVDYVPINLAPQDQTINQSRSTNGRRRRLHNHSTSASTAGLARRAASLITTVPGLPENFKTTAIQNQLSGNNLTGAGGNYVWLPALFDFTVNLTVQNIPAVLRSFNLDSFRTGKLLKNGGWS